jgi:hypothetical protein
MKKFTLFLSAMLISIMTFAGTVTFEIGQDKVADHKQGTAAVLTKDGVTLDVSKGAFGRDDNFRIYAGFGMTISCEYGNITGVEITCTAAAGGTQYGPDFITTTVGSYSYADKVGTWTGNEASVAFSATKQVRFTKLVVTYASSDANFVSQPMITGDVNFADTANVIITADEGMKIYYTIDGTDPTTASTEYTVPFQVTTTTTVKAIAYNEATASSSVVSETVFTQATKSTCAEAAAIALTVSGNNVTTDLTYCIEGYVTSLKDTFNISTKKQLFWIADTKTGGEVLYSYNNQVPCALVVGMKVRMVGKLTKWNTGQYMQSQIVNAKVTILPEDVTPTPVEIVGIVKRALQLNDTTIILTHEANGTPHIYTVAGDAIAEVSQEGVVAKDSANAGDYLTISDIALTEDGKLVAVNQMICQAAIDYVDAGYKRGENRFYIWNTLANAPSVWFTSQMYANWFRSNNGQSMAIKGTSANAQIALTGYHITKSWARIATYKVIDGVYTEPADAATGNDNYTWCEGPASGDIDDNIIGKTYELNASPFATENWIIDGNLVNPIEYVTPAGIKSIISTLTPLAVDLGKKFNGAYYVTVGGKKVMVAPYADAEGKLAGVKLLDITDGFANATPLATKESLDLAAPVAATGVAATAVVESNGSLTINLIADATIHTMTATILPPVEIVGVVKRALQAGETTIILTHEANGTPHIYTVAGKTIAEVSQEGVVAKDSANAGDYLTISDIALTEDGKLVACNYVRNQFDASYIESGYKRGTLHLYVWHDIKGAASIWFESMFTGNSLRGDCGYTMAVNGTVANANILVTAVHNSHRGVRMSHYTVIDSAYVEPNYANSSFNNHLFYVGAKFKGASAGSDAATFNEATHGVNYQLNASPLAENNWVMDSEGLMPTEFGVAAQEDPSIVGAVAETLVSKALVGAYYVTVGDKKVMVAPYADAEGKLAGVKLLDITAGFANATLLTTAESLDLTAPVAATGVATTAVVESNGTLTINLIADATIHTMTATIQESPSTNLENNNVQNDIIKFYQNGQIYIMINGAVYNVMGQMVK